MARHPHPCVSLSAGRGYVILMLGEHGSAQQMAVSSAEARAIADALRREADAADLAWSACVRPVAVPA